MDDALTEYRNRRNENWKLIRSIHAEYTKLIYSCPELDFNFTEYIEANYGIVLQSDEQGNILHDYSISDEPKYIFCLLKHR